VTVNVAGSSSPLSLDFVSHPALLEQSITRNRDAVRRRAEIQRENDDKAQMKEWFAAVLGEMIIPAPDLRGLSLEEAMERTQPVGLRLMVMGDHVAMPGVPPGLVVSQSPMPGSRMLRSGDISVVLSRSP
jgi:hypothetical protein